MHICDNKHGMIIFDAYSKCPLCSLREHNDVVHDFIESKGDLVKELVQYQHKRNSTTKEDQQKQTANTDYTAVLFKELQQQWNQNRLNCDTDFLPLLAKHLNAAIQKQHCA